MATTPRERFLAERQRCRNIENEAVADVLGYGFADALDPEIPHVEIPVIEGGALAGRESKSNNTSKTYLSALRTAHGRGLDLLGADGKTVNLFFNEVVTERDERRSDLVADDYDDHLTKGTARGHQAATRALYRWATDPNPPDDTERPDTAVEWADVNGSRNIRMFPNEDRPTHVTEDNDPDGDDLDAMRVACLEGQNTRRDRSFLEIGSGTGQRVYCLVTLLVRGVRGHIDAECSCDLPFPHIRLNPEIDGDGDKGAIEKAGTVRPFVADPEPVKQWLRNHPLNDAETREGVVAPDDFRDVYVFVGDLNQTHTEPADHWDEHAANDMLKRRKANTADLPGVETVDADVNPHAWRAFAYTRSKNLPIPEKVRRAVFGWSPGSDTGPKFYDNSDVEAAMRRFAESHADAFGGGDKATSVTEQVAGASVAGDLAPEVRREIADEVVDEGVVVTRDEFDDLVAAVAQLADGADEADPDAGREQAQKISRTAEGNNSPVANLMDRFDDDDEPESVHARDGI